MKLNGAIVSIFSKTWQNLKQKAGDCFARLTAKKIVNYDENNLSRARRAPAHAHNFENALLTRTTRSRARIPACDEIRLCEERVSVKHFMFYALSQNKDLPYLCSTEIAILCFIFDQCDAKNSPVSDLITSTQIHDLTGISISAARKLLPRLSAKLNLNCLPIKHGKYCYRQIELPENLFSGMREIKKNVNLFHAHETDKNISSSYNNNININININKILTTTKFLTGLEPRSPEIHPRDQVTMPSSVPAKENDENWGAVNFDVLKKIGFSKLQIRQLKKFNNPITVQESINHFAWALEHNPSVKKHLNPIRLLMGVLRKGEAWREAHYESPQQIAIRQVFESKKRSQQEIDKLLDEMANLEFGAWRKSLSPDQVAEFLGNLKNIRAEHAQEAHLRNYYKQQILIPQLKTQGTIK